MHGPKSKFIMKIVQFSKQEEFSKRGRIFLKLKKMGGEEETILKHEVKDRDKNHLTNKKPILDIICEKTKSQSISFQTILPLWILSLNFSQKIKLL